MYANILIATDGSELAGKAVQDGIALAKRIGAKATVLTVSPPFHIFTTDTQMIEDTPAQYQVRMQKHTEIILVAAASAAHAAGVACETVHVEHERGQKAATLSSWRRTAAAAFPPSSLAARRSRYSPIPKFRYWSIDEPRGHSLCHTLKKPPACNVRHRTLI
jgi:hypothetical protein